MKSFFDSSPLEVAPQLVGCLLCKHSGKCVLTYTITEVEAYLGSEDLASHARFGKTVRNAPMFGPSGVWYIYLCYGIHSMLNVVTGQKNCPSGILIRSVEGITGPGRLTRQLGIDMSFNGLICAPSSGLWIDVSRRKSLSVKATPRIGVDYAGLLWSKKMYRFIAC